MSERTLESISDYNELKGEKKTVVWGVIIVGVIIGSLYVIAGDKYNQVDDTIKVQQSVKNIPVK